MGKGKAVLLHLLAVAAGWGIVAVLRPVVGSWQRGGEAAAESRAPSKTSRVRSTAEIAAGQKLLQRYTDAQAAVRPGGTLPNPGPELSLRDMVDSFRRDTGFDPAAPAPSRNDEIQQSEEERDAFANYHMILGGVLGAYLEGNFGPDLAHAFRVGRLDAGTLYDSLAAHLPGAAADHTLRRALYDELAPLDPVRAATLLQPMPEDEATRKKYETLSAAQASALSPEASFAIFSTIPKAEVGSWLNPNRATWTEATYAFASDFGTDYLPWLEQLPAGTHRDHFAAPVLHLLEDRDLPGYRRIRLLVTDPEILKEYPPR